MMSFKQYGSAQHYTEGNKYNRFGFSAKRDDMPALYKKPCKIIVHQTYGNHSCHCGIKTTKKDFYPLIIEGDNRVTVACCGELQPLKNKEAAINLSCQGLEVWATKVDIPAIAETPEGEDDIFSGPVWYVIGSEDVEAVEF
jgi:hypothetical protein